MAKAKKDKFVTAENYKSPKMPIFSREEPVYQVQQVPLKKGALRPVEVGKTDIYARTQASCGFKSVKELVERYKRGDISALQKVQGFYGDVSNMPNCLNDVNEVVRNAQSTYHKLPADIKSMFGNYDEFIKAVSDGSYIEKLKDFNKLKDGDIDVKIDKDIGNGGVPVLPKEMPQENK